MALSLVQPETHQSFVLDHRPVVETSGSKTGHLGYTHKDVGALTPSSLIHPVTGKQLIPLVLSPWYATYP